MKNNNNKNKNQCLVNIEEPRYIHKTVEGKELTIMINKYALPWNKITDVPCDVQILRRVLPEIKKLKNSYADAYIEFNYNEKAPAFIFKVTGKTLQRDGDKPCEIIGNRIARAKALSRACLISMAIIRCIKKGLEEELNKNEQFFIHLYNKERLVIAQA